MFPAYKNTKRISSAIAVTFALITTSVVFSHPGFGSFHKLRGTHGWINEPIIACTDPTPTAGTATDCYVDLGTPPSSGTAHATTGSPLGQAVGAPNSVHIYSDPVGVAAYDGTLSSTTGVVSVPISANAPAGPVTIYLQTSTGAIASDTITVSSAN